MMEKNWFISVYRDGDERRIIPLFSLIFDKKRTLKRWDWEFKRNPEGFKVLIAEDGDGNLIAHLGALHRKVKIGQGKALTSLEVDGMTHPDFTHRGIFVALGKRLLSDMEKEGVDLVMGFPNAKALPGHRKMGCIELFTPDVMVKPINFRNVSKKMFSNRFLARLSEIFGRLSFRVIYRTREAQIGKDLSIKEINEFDSRFDEFWEEASSMNYIILSRDGGYLNWRYAECPDQDYSTFIAEKDDRIMGYVVVRVMDLFGLRTGAIVDIMTLPDHVNIAHTLVLNALEHLTKQNVDLVACMMPKWCSYNKVLKNCGFVTCPKRLNPKPQPFIVYPLSKDIDLEAVKNPHNWYISFGDTDVV
jgi:hypothetical protein